MSRKDPWRWRCPNEHAAWHNYPGDETPGDYYCESCDDYFERLYDMKNAKPKPEPTQ